MNSVCSQWLCSAVYYFAAPDMDFHNIGTAEGSYLCSIWLSGSNVKDNTYHNQCFSTDFSKTLDLISGSP